ncbi:DUF6893 family small protein [Streptomyces sp. NPDC059851]
MTSNKTVIGGWAAAVLALLVLKALLPDLQRYLRIRRM